MSQILWKKEKIFSYACMCGYRFFCFLVLYSFPCYLVAVLVSDKSVYTWSVHSGPNKIFFFFRFSTEFLFNFHSLSKWKWNEVKRRRKTLSWNCVQWNRSTQSRTKKMRQKMPTVSDLWMLLILLLSQFAHKQTADAMANEVVPMPLPLANKSQRNSCEHQ